jgi:hypothetical protein
VSVTLSEVLLSAPELIVILVEERYGEQRIRMKTDSGTQPEERKNGRTEERKKKLRLENGWKYSGALSSVALHNDDLRKKEERNQVERR